MVIGNQRAVTKQEWDEYERIVDRLARGGDDPEFGELCAVLAAVGKTVVCLARDVSERRRNL